MEVHHEARAPHARGILTGTWRMGGVLVALVLALAIASSGYAGISDINPDTSSNSNANASSGGRVNGLANASANNQVYYAASEYGGLFKTTDGGNNWSRLNGHQPVMTWDVDVDTANNNKVYATSWYDGRVNSLAGIEVSSDAGATWTKPATTTPPNAYNCSATRKTEPSAFGIGSDASNNVYIGTNCGVAISTDAGATWTFVDPTPGTAASDVWDVVVQGATIDICGDDGHLRSTNSGTTWTADAGLGIPTGRCSIAASPDESYVLFIVASDNNVYETDDAGANWTNHGQNGGQGRIPFVETNQRSNAGMTDRFSLWYADTQLLRGDCTTPTPPAQGGANRCGNTSGYSNQQSGAHWDAGDVVFDSAVSPDSCPMIYSSDGGVHRRTGGCESPTWTRSNVGVHATFIWACRRRRPGRRHERGSPVRPPGQRDTSPRRTQAPAPRPGRTRTAATRSTSSPTRPSSSAAPAASAWAGSTDWSERAPATRATQRSTPTRQGTSRASRGATAWRNSARTTSR